MGWKIFDSSNSSSCHGRCSWTTSVMNYATVASDGRYYIGDFNSKICGGAANSTLFSYSPSNGLNVVLTGMVMNQGLVFVDKLRKFYHLDGCSYRIVEYDWDPSTGQVCKRKVDVFKLNGDNYQFLYLLRS